MPNSALETRIKATTTDILADQKRYQSMVGSLMYAMLATKLDLAQCVQQISQFSQMLKTTHEKQQNMGFDISTERSMKELHLMANWEWDWRVGAPSLGARYLLFEEAKFGRLIINRIEIHGSHAHAQRTKSGSYDSSKKSAAAATSAIRMSSAATTKEPSPSQTILNITQV
jgi:hypothetical protein